MKNLVSYLRNKKGSNAVEYGLIVSLVSLGIIVGAQIIKTNLGTVFETVGNILTVAITP